jgi:hypothetical protein
MQVILSSGLWLGISVLCYLCYKLRERWRPEATYWNLWLTASILFFIRETTKWLHGDWVNVAFHTLGMLSASFMVLGFYSLYTSFFEKTRRFHPFYVFPALFLIGIPLFMASGFKTGGIGYIYMVAENVVWIIASLGIIFYVLMLAVKLRGGLVWAMFPAAFAAYLAGMWNILEFVEIIGGAVPRGITDTIEILFGFSIASTFISFYLTLHEMAPPAYKVLEKPPSAGP